MRFWDDAFRELEALRDEIFRSFDSFFASRPQLAFLPGISARSYPLLNIYEDAETFKVHAIAPGLDKEKLDVSVLGNQLTISGEKKKIDKDIKAEQWHRRERAEGRFIRTIELPSDIDEEKVEATYKNGILEIVLPKAEDARPKKVNVLVEG